jgi:hypothetical protein
MLLTIPTGSLYVEPSRQPALQHSYSPQQSHDTPGKCLRCKVLSYCVQKVSSPLHPYLSTLPEYFMECMVYI